MKKASIALSLEVEAARATHLATLPKPCQKTYVGAVFSRRKAILAKCQDCMGYEEHSKRIRECSVFACPLWPLRPYQVSK